MPPFPRHVPSAIVPSSGTAFFFKELTGLRRARWPHRRRSTASILEGVDIASVFEDKAEAYHADDRGDFHVNELPSNEKDMTAESDCDPVNVWMRAHDISSLDTMGPTNFS